MSKAEDTANERPPGRMNQPASETGPEGDNQAAVARSSVAPAATAAEAAAAAEPARIGYIGKRLGRFHISAELGRGGMATVYRAHDPQLGRDVAVKVMHGFFAGRADIEARFRREANAVAAIRHPSILALYDFAPPAGEEPGYIVSELIEGPGLRQLLDTRSGRLLPEMAANIAIRVAEALGAAHAAGIVHRDVKPDNVLIDRSGGRIRVVLTDFGVAHVSGMDTMTATGAVLGSPAYMSPEQARGEDVGPASDVFSLGVMMYQLCTGHLPFSGKDPLAVLAAILRGEYLRPAKVEARVSPPLEQVITRCLHRDPATRFADGTAVAAALRALVSSDQLADEDESLGRFLADPGAFEREVSPGIGRIALAAAEEARRRGQLPRALAEVGRALAYAPDDPAAHDLLSRLGSGRRSRAVGVIVAGAAIAVLGTSAFVLVPRLRGNSPPTTVAQPAAGAAPATLAATQRTAPAPPEITSRGDEAAGAESDINVSAERKSAPANRPGSAFARSRPRRSTSAGTSAGQTQVAAMRTGPAAVGSTSPSAPPPPALPSAATGPTGLEPAPTPDGTSPRPPPPADDTKGASLVAGGATAGPAAAAAAAAATGSIIVRASHGFCEPSLDAHPPSLRANYSNLAPGPHEVFCTLPQGGGKVHVATYQLRPGTRPSLIVVRGADGRPVLGRPE